MGFFINKILKPIFLSQESNWIRRLDELTAGQLDVANSGHTEEEKDEFVMIKANKLDIDENQVTARFADYELGFQLIIFEGDTEPTMTMSKYDYKNDKFLEHYKCDAKSEYIE